MPFPISHIVLTNKVFNHYFQKKDKKEFFIGTCLPDIRYLKIIERNKTHFDNQNIATLLHKKPFYSGFKFHSLLDKTRTDFFNTKNILKPYMQSKYHVLALNVIEDDIFYDKIDNWNEYINYLNDILKQEILLGVNKNNIRKWHKILQENFAQKPNDITRHKILSKIFFSNDEIKIINSIAHELSNNKQIITIIKKTYDKIETIIK